MRPWPGAGCPQMFGPPAAQPSSSHALPATRPLIMRSTTRPLAARAPVKRQPGECAPQRPASSAASVALLPGGWVAQPPAERFPHVPQRAAQRPQAPESARCPRRGAGPASNAQRPRPPRRRRYRLAQARNTSKAARACRRHWRVRLSGVTPALGAPAARGLVSSWLRPRAGSPSVARRQKARGASSLASSFILRQAPLEPRPPARWLVEPARFCTQAPAPPRPSAPSRHPARRDRGRGPSEIRNRGCQDHAPSSKCHEGGVPGGLRASRSVKADLHHAACTRNSDKIGGAEARTSSQSAARSMKCTSRSVKPAPAARPLQRTASAASAARQRAHRRTRDIPATGPFPEVKWGEASSEVSFKRPHPARGPAWRATHYQPINRGLPNTSRRPARALDSREASAARAGCRPFGHEPAAVACPSRRRLPCRSRCSGMDLDLSIGFCVGKAPVSAPRGGLHASRLVPPCIRRTGLADRSHEHSHCDVCVHFSGQRRLAARLRRPSGKPVLVVRVAPTRPQIILPHAGLAAGPSPASGVLPSSRDLTVRPEACAAKSGHNPASGRARHRAASRHSGRYGFRGAK